MRRLLEDPREIDLPFDPIRWKWLFLLVVLKITDPKRSEYLLKKPMAFSGIGNLDQEHQQHDAVRPDSCAIGQLGV